MPEINKILIANRGEIANRIIRTTEKLNIKSVVVYSKEDRDALFVKNVDEAYLLEGDSIGETYLNIEQIIEIAKNCNSNAIHPGYGFLAENADFAKRCNEEGLEFIGPDPIAIKIMGDKLESREFVSNLGVPVTKGSSGNEDEILKEVEQFNFPVIVKASAGGGGKGMRVVKSVEKLKETLEATSREAKSYFGDGTVYVEEYIENPRHIEVQVLTDKFGNVIHLFERECSIQRRHQKIIEEAPSPTIDNETRKKICSAAVKIAENIKYESAGTIEFLVDENLNFYFLEMNTRIQVEHPVTEMTTGIDLVEQQIKIASGEKIDFNQKDIIQNGHAIECRIYAEDPENNFAPAPGKINFYKQPKLENIRLDSALNSPEVISSNYDPMISKLISFGKSRAEAIEKSKQALSNYRISGIKTNIPFLFTLLDSQDFRENKISTKYCDEKLDLLIESIQKEREKFNTKEMMIGAFVYSFYNPLKKSVWDLVGYWRALMKVKFRFAEKEFDIKILNKSESEMELEIENENYKIDNIWVVQHFIAFNFGKKKCEFEVFNQTKNLINIFNGPFIFEAERLGILDEKETFSSNNISKSDGVITSAMPGKVIKVLVKEGEKVSLDDDLIIVESMKMENSLKATIDGIVDSISVKEGDSISDKESLIILKKSEGS